MDMAREGLKLQLPAAIRKTVPLKKEMTYEGLQLKENDHAKKMFADSLHAALSLHEIRELVITLDMNPEGVQQTSDRHWTWAAHK